MMGGNNPTRHPRNLVLQKKDDIDPAANYYLKTLTVEMLFTTLHFRFYRKYKKIVDSKTHHGWLQ